MKRPQRDSPPTTCKRPSCPKGWRKGQGSNTAAATIGHFKALECLKVEPAPWRTKGWHQRLQPFDHAVFTTCLAHALTPARLRKHRRQRRCSNRHPCGPSYITTRHPSVTLARHRVLTNSSQREAKACTIPVWARGHALKPPHGATRPTCLNTIVWGLAESASLQLSGCHMRRRHSVSARCHPNVTRRADRGTCTRHRAVKSLATAGFEPALSWVSLLPQPIRQACAVECRSPWPPGWTSVLSDGTHGSCGVRNHATVDKRLHSTPETTRQTCDEDVRCHPDAWLSAQSSAKASLTLEQT